MVILPAADPYLPAGDAERLEAGLSARPQAWGPDALWRADAGHLMAVVAAPDEYRDRLREFVSGALTGDAACDTGNSTKSPAPSRR
jgi:hypothetical protein